jgi:N-acetylglucosamine-6-phosphate deacetylase
MRYNRKGNLIPGYDADIAVFSKEFEPLCAMVGGVIKYNVL